MRSFLRKYNEVDWSDGRTGGSTIEYGLVALLVAIVIIGVLVALGTEGPDMPSSDQPIAEEVSVD